MKEREFVPPAKCVLQEMEVRGVMHHLSAGPVEGYELRLQVMYPPTPTTPARTEWLPWVFATHQDVEGIARYLTEYMHAKGHLRPSPPSDATVQ